MPSPQHKKKIAIFDFDGTLFRSSLLIELCLGLVKKGVFPKSAKAELQGKYTAWANRTGTYEDFITTVIAVYSKYVAGCKQSDIQLVARKVILENRERVYRHTRDLIQELRHKKYFLLAISGSPQEIVSEFNRFWKFDAVYGTVYLTDTRGRYTGKKIYETKKDAIMKKFLAAHPELTLAASVGIGDTETDSRFLSLVDYPIAFNPNVNLLSIAAKKNWSIVVERKDVVYEIRRGNSGKGWALSFSKK